MRVEQKPMMLFAPEDMKTAESAAVTMAFPREADPNALSDIEAILCGRMAVPQSPSGPKSLTYEKTQVIRVP